MPSTTSNRRSRSEVEDDSEADAVRYSSSPDASPPPSEGPKRRRSVAARRVLGDDEDEDNTFYSVNEQMGDEDSSEDVPDRRMANGSRTNGSGRDGFQPGAIVRVCVENFVTYERAEFFPGPNLNMVIGPNGTGKSSLVCAICLGLGYPPHVLGRSTQPGEYVKHGKDHAVVEIELMKRPKDSRNPVVRLRINHKDNKRQFWINGKETNQKDLKNLIRGLRIQIDNLCQFLPQDKVAEFAALNSVDLLSKTLQAAAAPEMIEMQEQLKTIYKEQKDIEEHSKSAIEELKQLENRQLGLQADVDRLRERQEIQQLVADYEDARVVVQYNDVKNLHRAAKRGWQDAEAELQRLKDSNEPSVQALRSKEAYHERVVSALHQRTRNLKSAEDSASGIKDDIEDLDAKLKSVDDKRESSQKQRQKQKAEIGEHRKKIDQWQKRYDKGSNGFKPADWNTKIREQDHLLRENESTQRELSEQYEELRSNGRKAREREKGIVAQIENLASKQGQAMNLLRRMNPDVATALDWLDNNKDQFEKEVFGPPMLSCSVKDPRYSDQIQSMISGEDFFCLTAQTRSDYFKLSDQFYKTMKLAVTLRTSERPLDSYRRPVPPDELARSGLDGFAIDFLEGPEPVLAMLCNERKLHTSAVALDDRISSEQHDALVDGDKITTWVTSKSFCRVTRRREYGPSAVNTVTRFLQPGKFWKDEPVDGAETAALKRQLAEMKGTVEECKEAFEVVKGKKSELAAQEQEINEEITRLRTEKNELQMEFNTWQGLPQKIENQKKLLEQRQEALLKESAEIHDLDKEKDKLVLSRAKLALRYQKQNERIREAYQAVDEAHVCRLEAASDIQGLKDRSADITRMLGEKQQESATLRAEMTRLSKLGKNVRAAVEELFSRDEDKRDWFEALCKDKTLEDLENDIAAEQAKLDLIQATNPRALEEFEKRAKLIEKLSRQKAAQQKELDEMQARIDEIRSDWEPKVDALIAEIDGAFSNNFSKISCAGEVGIHKDEDFEKWAIEIKVKFRENETLQKLDQHRQSGGERAVSTIFYLMSLQSMAQAPFRVVDEINQGMDPRNERMVHERMVEIACHEHSSQYFLITPKLLPGLRYDARMKVLCIASGEHMPEAGPDPQRLDFRRCVQIQKRLLAAAAG